MKRYILYFTVVTVVIVKKVSKYGGFSDDRSDDRATTEGATVVDFGVDLRKIHGFGGGNAHYVH